MYLNLNLNLQYSFKKIQIKGNQYLQPIRCIALRTLQTSNGFWVFLFRQSFEWGGVVARHNATHSPSLARKLRMTL